MSPQPPHRQPGSQDLHAQTALDQYALCTLRAVGLLRRARRPGSALRGAAVAAATALALAACGSSSATHSATTHTSSSSGGAGGGTATTGTATSSAPTPAVDELSAAEHPPISAFPPVHGQTLTQLGSHVDATAQLGAATGSFVPGTRRYAFGLSTSSGAFIYAPTALYIAPSPSSKQVQGPFLAPDDPMTVAPQYRSVQNSGPGGIKAIYEAQLPLTHAGTYSVLALTRTSQGVIGSPGEIAVAKSSPIPDVGQHAPATNTDTLASVHGDISLLTTRKPPEDMHSTSFRNVLGKRPVALLISTPQLCTSRVCGPVTDIVVSLQHEFANRITFLHQEVYVDNDPSKGLRPPLHAFHLQTEPWLFVINRGGVITARLEGAFGVVAVRRALESALS
jgi:hypothetical protein